MHRFVSHKKKVDAARLSERRSKTRPVHIRAQFVGMQGAFSDERLIQYVRRELTMEHIRPLNLEGLPRGTGALGKLRLAARGFSSNAWTIVGVSAGIRTQQCSASSCDGHAVLKLH